jgi:hypothetical protein
MSTPSLQPIPTDRALVHVTHWKAGSQWVLGLLRDVFGGHVVVEPKPNVKHLFDEKMQGGKVYPCAYVNKLEFDALIMPENSRRVVLIRDLRDTLVSWYFSIRNTRLEVGQVPKLQWFLDRLSKEQGLLYMMEVVLPPCAYIQRSWLEGGEQVMHFEEFMTDPVPALGRFFKEFWSMELPAPLVSNLAERHSFAKYSGGRSPGEENSKSHYRKGTHGDWRQHLTPGLIETFKARYADLMILSGYEKDDKW